MIQAERYSREQLFPVMLFYNRCSDLLLWNFSPCATGFGKHLFHNHKMHEKRNLLGFEPPAINLRISSLSDGLQNRILNNSDSDWIFL